jgi:hypothetical protein
MSESTTTIPIPPGIYHITVAGHGALHNERLTAEPHVTITPASAHPNPGQQWQVNRGRIPGTITIARPGNIRPPLSITIKGDHGHPKPGDKLVVQREEFSTDWFPDPAGPPHQYYIRVPRHDSHVAEAYTVEGDVEESDGPHPRSLGFAIAPERIYPPFLEIDYRDQLIWVFQFLHPHALEEEA